MRIIGISICILLGSCAPASPEPNMATTVKTESGLYQVERNPKFEDKMLPANSDLKMLDDNILSYALEMCDLDFADNMAPDRCEIFVQPDKSGLLTGYVALLQGSSVRVKTALETDRQRGGQGCDLVYWLKNQDGEDPNPKLDISKNFEADLPIFGWEKNPGDWMLSPDDSGGQATAHGVWHFKKLNNNLRITEDGWNQGCYSNDRSYIDEVFVRAVTLTHVRK